jgi:MoaA/NifB/PqqE/SkfB family radical SAM enzyme
MDPRARECNLALQRGERARGKTRLASLPTEILIEPTNRCARNCPTCARNFYDPRANPPGDLSAALLARIAPLFTYAERVVIGGYGEPLLAEITPAVIRAAQHAGCGTSLITGQGNLSDAHASRLARAGLDEILFSVDGADDATLPRRRGYARGELWAAIGRLRAAKPGISIGFNVTLRRDNLDELPAIVKLAGACKAKSVAVHHQKIYTRAQAGDSALRRPEAAQAAFAAAQLVAAAAGVRLELPPLGGVQPCDQPYRLLAFRSNGVVQGCCSALFESARPGLRLGRVPQDNPFDLWNAPPMRAARGFLQRREPPPIPCENCAFRVFTPEAHERFLDEPAHA